jgi:cation transport regulator
MPYKNNKELPEQVKNVLPDDAQNIYRAAYNNAFDEYKDPDDREGDATREEVSHKVAWAAVKNVYQKSDDGNWVKK